MCEKAGIFNSKSVPTYRTRTFTKKAYRTSTITEKAYCTSLQKLRRTVPYLRSVPYCHPCCQGLHRWLETRWESRCGLLCRIPKQLLKPSIFPPWNLQYCVPGRSLCYFRSGKVPAFGKKCTINLLLRWLIVKQLSNHS